MIIYVQQVEQRGGCKLKNRVKEERELQGLSQEQLSNKSEVSRTIISELENGKTDVITNVTLEKIAKALGKKVTDIFFTE
jgi:transcriptional regulator with XRE-family HTH domain